jgi:preprotein translocase subunit SecD
MALGLFKTRFFLWIAAAIVSSYLLFSFNYNEFKNSEKSFVSRVYQSIGMPGLNLGIDLQGGTRFVLRVDIDKAVEIKLAESGKLIEKSLKKAKTPLPTSRSLSKGSLGLAFSNVAVAGSAVDIIKKRFPEFGCKRNEEKVSITLSAAESAKIKSNSVEQAVQVLRTRLDTIAVKGLSVSRHGDSGVVVMLPGVDDVDDIKQTIMRAARLEFKIVDKSAGSKEALLDQYDGMLPPDRMMVPGKDSDDEDGTWYSVSIFPDITGERIQDARFDYDGHGAPAIHFTMDSEGAREFRELTRSNIKRNLAIIMDERVVSAPTIQSEIGRDGNITGVSQEEAVRTSALLRSGSLSAPLKMEQESRVGATMGQDSIRQGLFACLVSLLLIFVFSIFYYGFAGLLAFFALAYNLLLTLLFLSYFKATLTLPGIAGMVLTIGMAIDSSILIYERIREELASGSAYKKAIHNGFNGAMKVILDSNITTFISGAVLFWYGGPAVRGFAVTLMLGVISTILAGVYFLKSTFDFVIDNTRIEKINL